MSKKREASSTSTSAQRLETLSTDPAMRSIVAGNPAAPAHLLESLAHDLNARVRQAVAGNPNTPWEVLQKLAWVFPYTFLSNPIVPLLMVIDPEQIRISDPLWEHLLWETELPPLWWNWLRSQPVSKVSPSVRLQVQYAGETMHLYGESRVGEEHLGLALVELLAAALVQGASLPPLSASTGQEVVAGEQIIEKYFRWLAHAPDKKVRRVIAGHPQTPVELLQMLALDQDGKVRRFVASNPQTPEKILFALAGDQDDKVRRHVASNPQTPPTLLQSLASASHAGIRGDVSTHRQTPVEVLRTLALDPRAGVRRAVARNPQAPADILFLLALDQDIRVRRAVARNSSASVKALRLLALDRDIQVRRAVVGHPQMPIDILCILALDEDKRVSRQARWQVHIARMQAGKGAVSPGELGWQERLKLHTDASIKYASIEKQLDRIAGLDVSEDIRRRIIAALATCWSPTEIQRSFAEYRTFSSSNVHAMRKCYHHLMAPFMPAIALQKLSASPCWGVRYLVALNARTPRETRQRLRQDGNRYVRAVARARTVQLGEQEVD